MSNFTPGTLVEVGLGIIVIVTYDKYAKPESERFSGVKVWPKDDNPLAHADRTWLKEGAVWVELPLVLGE